MLFAEIIFCLDYSEIFKQDGSKRIKDDYSEIFHSTEVSLSPQSAVGKIIRQRLCSIQRLVKAFQGFI